MRNITFTNAVSNVAAMSNITEQIGKITNNPIFKINHLLPLLTISVNAVDAIKFDAENIQSYRIKTVVDGYIIQGRIASIEQGVEEVTINKVKHGFPNGITTYQLDDYTFIKL